MAAARDSIQGVLFDATGTLIHPREAIGEVYARIARDYAVDLPAWRLDDAFKRVLRHAPPRVFPDAAAADLADLEERWWYEVVRSTFLASDSTARFDDPPAFHSRLYRYYASADAWSLPPAAAEVLASLARQGLLLGVVSNFDQRLLEILEALDIARFFRTTMIPARCRSEKPDPAIFESALSDLGLEAGHVVYVGDDPEKDLAAASRVGMRVVDVGELSSFAALPLAIEKL